MLYLLCREKEFHRCIPDNGDQELESKINAEAAARTAQDEVLHQQIVKETSDRQNADNGLGCFSILDFFIDTFTQSIISSNSCSLFSIDIILKNFIPCADATL